MPAIGNKTGPDVVAARKKFNLDCRNVYFEINDLLINYILASGTRCEGVATLCPGSLVTGRLFFGTAFTGIAGRSAAGIFFVSIAIQH